MAKGAVQLTVVHSDWFLTSVACVRRALERLDQGTRKLSLPLPLLCKSKAPPENRAHYTKQANRPPPSLGPQKGLTTSQHLNIVDECPLVETAVGIFKLIFLKGKAMYLGLQLTFICDRFLPIPSKMKNKYTCIVFSVPRANCAYYRKKLKAHQISIL